MANGDWSDAENDLIIADYFAMLGMDLAGGAYSKAEHRRRLSPLLDNRSEGSIEFKHQNISAVLLGLGQPWIRGYKPASRFQGSLVDAVLRWLDAREGLLAPGSLRPMAVPQGFAEDRPLWIGPPPTHSNQPPPIDLGMMDLIARKCDVAARDARNRELGKAGEALVLGHERATLRGGGRSDLADQVRWVSREDGDGAGFDIASFEPDGQPWLIEVKTTNGWDRTPFHITRNELAAADRHRDTWRLVRVWNFAREPTAFEIRPPLDAHVSLTPTSFLAALK
jgi:Domain of unknown function (DUF3883)